MKIAVLSMLSVAVLGALLLGATAAQHLGDARKMDLAARQNAADVRLILELSEQLKDARHALQARPVVEQRVQVPCAEDVGHETPIFARDAQFAH